MFMNICERFPYPYEYVYFTCSYLGRIFLDVDMLQMHDYLETSENMGTEALFTKIEINHE